MQKKSTRFLLCFSSLMLIFLLAFPVIALAGKFYVKPGGTGDGTSWARAFGDPQQAIEAAALDPDVNQVWVAEGTYAPTSRPNRVGEEYRNDPRSRHFSLRNGVKIFGGFSGNETDVSNRDFQANETILSGYIGREDVVGDNVYHVLFHPEGTNLDETALLDGFTITGGNADADRDNNNSHNKGGAIYNHGSSPTLKNLIIHENWARFEGAGIYNYESHPVLENVDITNNQSRSLHGGGIYNELSHPVFTGGTIKLNKAAEDGGGIYNISSNPVLQDIDIFQNKSASDGGGVYNTSSIPELSNVVIAENMANAAGGGIFNTNSSPELTRVSISKNQAGTEGGGIYNFQSNPVLIDVSVSENTGSLGGGIFNEDGYQTLKNVTISDNLALFDGGGVYSLETVQTLTNVTISGNTAVERAGGGTYSQGGYQTLINLTTAFNQAGTEGGGHYIDNNYTIMRNSIVWGNTGEDNWPDQIAYQGVAIPDITWSLIQDGYSDGEDILTADPLLENLSDNGGLTRTMAIPGYSPAYAVREDAGRGNWNNSPDKDQRRKERASSGFRAMGAYEDLRGSLQVTIEPADAVDAGAQWSTSGTQTWYNSDEILKFAKGEHTIEFKRIPGWDTPENMNVTINLDQLREEKGRYNLQDFTVTTGAGQGGAISPEEPQRVDYGDVLEFIVTPEADYEIYRVTGCGGNLSNSTYTTAPITQDCTVEALFRPSYYTVSAGVYPHQAGSITGEGTYSYGERVILKATPSQGYSFVSWTEGGDVISMDAVYSFRVRNDRTLTANFSPLQDEYTIDVQAYPTDGGTVSGGGTYAHGSSVTVTAQSHQGWQFLNWTENDLVVSQQRDYSFTASRDRNLTANFSGDDVIFVSQGGTGDGSSWSQAYGDLQAAIDAAVRSERISQVWVAKGTYRPTSRPNIQGSDDPRTVHFSLRNLVAVYGGFAGVEGTDFDLSQRDFENNETILSGDFGRVGGVEENAYHIFFHPEGTNLDETAVLDGFTITRGNADAGFLSPHRNGGGIYNHSSSPTLNNLVISGNLASGEGAGIYNYFSNPALTDVEISNNQSTGSHGGGMYNESSNPTMYEVTITNNQASRHGGGIYNETSSPVIEKTTISRNQASRGAGIYNNAGEPVFKDMTITDNQASSSGGGVYNDSSRPVFENIIISQNQAHGGGGIYNNSGEPVLKDATITENQSTSRGGGIYNDSSRPVITDVEISKNNARWGGGMYNAASTIHIENSTISENSAFWTGGGLDNDASIIILTNVTIKRNSGWTGGGMYNSGGNKTLTNVTLSNNHASWRGGGMFNSSGFQTLINVTVFQNKADYGGGIYNESSDPIIKNSIFWGNTARRGDNQIENDASRPDVSWSLIQGGYPGGDNIIADNPSLLPLDYYGGLFTKTHAIPEDSPAYAIPKTAGGGGWNNAPDEDQRGMPRATIGNRAMGAFEGVLNPGSLEVTIEPAQAIEAGAGWRLKGGSQWYESQTRILLPAGEHVIEFRDISFWITPDDLIANVSQGFTARERGIYEPVEYEVLAEAGPGGSISPIWADVGRGQTASFTLTPDQGHSIARVGGTCGGTLEGYVYTTEPVYFDCTVEAEFIRNTYTISVSANPGIGGIVSGSGRYDHGQNVTVTARASQAFNFVNWTESGNVLSTNASYSFTARSDRELEANFQTDTPEPPFPIPDTGQLRCYDNFREISCPEPGEDFHGQDASYQPWMARSYTKLGNDGEELPDHATHVDRGGDWVMTRDNVTGLIWEVKTLANRRSMYTHDLAEEYTQDLELGGFSDWRLPTWQELFLLVNRGKANPAIDENWFPNTMASSYWSSTVHALNSGNAWQVNFHHGSAGDNDNTNKYHVRAVRSDHSRQQNNLVDNNDGTVTDLNTGLMWQLQTAPGTYSWEQSLDYARNLTLAGHDDWRLPNINELHTLVDDTRYNLAVHPVLDQNTISSNYWSSTTMNGSPNEAWTVSFNYGYTYGISKTAYYNVRAVRTVLDVSLGSLTVIIEPAEAALAGVQWRRQGTLTWFDSGYIEDNVPTGEHVIEFKTVPGWGLMDSISVKIESDRLSVYNETCHEQDVTLPGVLMLLLGDD